MEKISQQVLRKKMLELKKKNQKRIDSPLAKYNDLGQLMCVLCTVQVRNENVWLVHLSSKSHRENVELAKKNKMGSTRNVESSAKRCQLPSQEAPPSKKSKTIADSGNAQNASPIVPFHNTVSSDNNKMSLTRQKMVDTNVEPMSIDSENSPKKEDKKSKDSSLPEGFFDDPIMDAKVRNVEYKDPIEEQWERFQKEMKEESAQSAQIIADDQEEATTERQIDEIEEQMRNYTRVMNLVKMKESVHRDKPDRGDSSSDESSIDDAEFSEDMDWRAKKI